jgi:hypothetical protein
MRYAGEETELAQLIEDAMRRDLELAILQHSLLEGFRRKFATEDLAGFQLPGWDALMHDMG